jgi:hypothetical protein
MASSIYAATFLLTSTVYGEPASVTPAAVSKAATPEVAPKQINKTANKAAEVEVVAPTTEKITTEAKPVAKTMEATKVSPKIDLPAAPESTEATIEVEKKILKTVIATESHTSEKANTAEQKTPEPVMAEKKIAAEPAHEKAAEKTEPAVISDTKSTEKVEHEAVHEAKKEVVVKENEKESKTTMVAKPITPLNLGKACNELTYKNCDENTDNCIIHNGYCHWNCPIFKDDVTCNKAVGCEWIGFISKSCEFKK